MSFSLLSLTALTLAALAPSFVGREAVYPKAGDVFPDLGSVDTSANYYQKWQPEAYGVKRVGDRDFLIHGKEEWGYRGTTYNTFDADTFRFSVDLSALPGNVAAFVLLSPNACDFVGGGGGGSCILSMDMVKSPSDSSNFIVTLTAGGDHNVSVAGYGDGAWPVDGAYSGASITAADGVIAVSFQNNGASTTVAVNDKTYTVDSSVLYAKLGTSAHTGMYASLGQFNGNGYGDIRVNYWGDATEDAYYSATGLYGVAKKGISDLQTAVDGGLDTLDKLQAAKTIRGGITLTGLHSFDVTYLKPKLDVLDTALANAATALGGEAVLADYEDELAKLTNLDANLVDKASIDAALAQVEVVNVKKEAASVQTMSATYTTDQAAKLTSLNSAFDAEIVKIKAAIKAFYAIQVTAYSEAAKALVTAEDINAAKVLRSAIPTEYNSYLSDDDLSAMNTLIAGADGLVDALGHAAIDGWTIGAGAYVVKDGDKMGIDLTASTGTTGQDYLQSSGVYYGKERLSAANFSFTIERKLWSTKGSSWFSFGIMEKSEIFNSTDNTDCQNNKGVFFLVTSIGNQKLKAELYTMSLTCNRFFDAVQSVTAEIPLSGDLTVSFAEIKKEISGVTDTYWVPSFNGVPLDGNNIKATKLKSCLGTDKSGYFYMASTDVDPKNPYVYNLVDVNGHKPFDATLVNGSAVAPTSSDAALGYDLSKGGDLIVNLDSQGQALTEVKLGETILTSADYTYDAAAKKLTIKASTLAKLAVGNVTLKVSTAGGSVSVAISVSKSAVTSTPTTSSNGSNTGGCGGCGGTIDGSIAASVITLFGLAGLAFRKKHLR